jgi:hypothetical protein
MGVEITERIELLKLRFLQNEYTYDIFKKSSTSKFKNETEYKAEFKKIMDYVQFKLKSSTDVCIYNFVEDKTDGRLFCSKSIQGLRRNIRGFLGDHTIDIDIKNAHPCILWNVCKKYEIICPYLEMYVLNRDDVLAKIIEDDGTTYENAKTNILAITNKKITNANKTRSDFLKGYIKEIIAIRKKLMEIPDYEYLKDHANREKNNFEGSFINHILCLHENEILTAMRTYLTENNFEIFALMFDGLMVYKSEQKLNLPFVEEYIYEQTQFENIHLAIKEHTTDIIMPDDYTPVERLDYQATKDLFQKNCCKVDAHFYKEDRMYSKMNFKVLYENLYYWSNGVRKAFIGEWFLDEDIRTYTAEDIYPREDMCPKDIYNLWRPWKALSADLSDPEAVNMQDYIQAGVDFFFNHIKIMCDNQEEVYNFVVNWLAQMFQYPEHKSIELIFISREGAGKGLFEEFLTSIMGSSKVVNTSDPQNDIFGSFNAIMKDAVLVIFNEANKANFYQQNDKKKALITDEKIQIRQKHLPAIQIKSYHRFITFTNNPDPSFKNKRRDIFIRCSDEKINCDEYFKPGWAFAKNKYVARAIYDYLMDMKIKMKITACDIPATAYDDFIKIAQKPAYMRFLEYYAYTKTGEFIETTNSLYEQFTAFTAENHIQFDLKETTFKSSIMNEGMQGCRVERHVGTHGRPHIYKINIPVLRVELDNKNK